MTMPLAGGSAPSVLIRAPAQQHSGRSLRTGTGWRTRPSSRALRKSTCRASRGPGPGIRYRVAGGVQARWRRDGRELFYRVVGSGGPVSIMAATVEPAGSGLRIGIPTRLFDFQVSTLLHAPPIVTYAVTADGQRFLVARAQGEGTTAFEMPLTVVVNWDAAINDRTTIGGSEDPPLRRLIRPEPKPADRRSGPAPAPDPAAACG